MSLAAVIIILVILFIVGLGGFLIWLKTRSTMRQAKNIERGLKMVPLLIHLPPSSEDTESGSRDQRDVTEESISKAQILYDIIATTAQTGFKSKFYGQRHISFEIVAHRGMIAFYTAVPVALVDVVQQAVVSAYPSATLQEVSEHNIFSPIGKISGTIGGELNLKGDYIQPIATFQEVKRDAMTAILNAMSNLSKEDGAGVQILLRPAKAGWDKPAHAYVEKTRKDKGKSSGGLGGFKMKDMVGALAKPPEASETKPEDKQLTNLEQQQLDSVEEKTRHAAYEVLIRIVASSNTATRSQTILNNIKASFALFDAPGKNGFEYAQARDIEAFVTAYIMRMFPPEVNKNVLNSVELATLYHFPDQRITHVSGLERLTSKQVDGPNNIPEHGVLLGYNVFRGVRKEIRLSDDDRRRHMYIVGQTGTGKSTALENLAVQDMIDGKGFAFIDPHGDAVDKLLSLVPKERTEDIIYFNPGDMDFPLGFNLFEFETEDQKDFIIQEVLNMLIKLYDPNQQGIIGPRYEHMFRNCALALMADPEGSTFIDVPKLFNDPQFLKDKLKHVNDQVVLDFWTKEIPASSRSNEFGEVKSWFVSKFGAFLSNKMMRNVIGQRKSAFNLRDIMDGKKILLVNLSKGKTGELNSKLLGMMFVMKFQAAAMSRANIPEDQRQDFTLYVDEFQNFSTDSFATILSEARKYRLNLIVANQFIGQLTEDIRDAVFGNVGSIFCMRAGATDADFLVKQFAPVFDVDDIIKIPNHQAIVRMMIGGVPSQPFSVNTLPPIGEPNPELLMALKRLSAAKYGKPRAVVEKEIDERLAVKEPEKPPMGARPGMPGQPGAPGGMPPAPGGQRLGQTSPGQFGAPKPGGSGGPSSGSSFLDEWLAKRRAMGKPVPGAKPSPSPSSAGAKPSTPAPQTAPASAPANLPPTQPKNPEPPKQDKADESGVLNIQRDESPKSGQLNIDENGNIVK